MKHTRSLSKMLGRIALATLVLLLVVVAGSWSYDAVASPRVLRDYPPSGGFVTIEGANMHYVCQGTEDPALVLVHGYAGGASDWQPLMEALPTDQRACAFDRLGADYSDIAHDDDRDMAAVVDELHEAITQLGIEEPVVVGHSLGGAIVQLYAAKYPVSGVISVEGLSADVADDVVRRLGSYAALSLPARLGLLRPMASSFVSPAYAGALRERQVALRSRSDAILAIANEGTLAEAGLDSGTLRRAEDALSAPLLVIAAGETDVPEGEQFTQSLLALAGRHPNSELHVVPDAPHYVMATHPVQTAQIIATWMDEVVSPILLAQQHRCTATTSTATLGVH